MYSLLEFEKLIHSSQTVTKLQYAISQTSQDPTNTDLLGENKQPKQTDATHRSYKNRQTCLLSVC